MKSYYLTDSGRVRSHNEDSVTIVKNQSGEHLMMVADGMGGHRAGEIASSMVVTHLGSRFSNINTIGTKFDAVNWLNEPCPVGTDAPGHHRSMPDFLG